MSGVDRADLVIRAPRVLTMSQLGMLEDGCVAVSQGNIEYVGHDPCPSSEERLELRHHLLMPGLVDAHAYTYLLAAGRRGSPRPSAEALYWSALFAYTTMLLSGVTAVRDSAPEPSILADAARRSGIRVLASKLLEPGEGGGWPEATARASDGWSGRAAGRLALDVSGVDVPPGPEYVRAVGARLVVGASIPLSMARALRDLGVGIVVTPSQALEGRWAGGIIRMRSVGVEAALGTGIRSLYSIPNLLEEARIALHLDAVGGFEPSPLPIVESMTSSAGSVLGEPIGRISPGYRADLVALDLRRPHLRFPPEDPYSAVVFSATRGDFDYVIVNGEVVVEEGRHRWLYPEGIARKLESVIGSG